MEVSPGVVIAATGAAVGAYLLLSGSGPSASVPSPAPIASSVSDVEAVVAAVAKNKQAWATLALSRKLEYLREMTRVLRSTPELTSGEGLRLPDQHRNLTGTLSEGVGAMFGVGQMGPYVLGLTDLYEALVQTGRPPAPVARRAVGATHEAVVVSPRGLWQKMTAPQRVELFSEPGKKLTQLSGLPNRAECVGVMSAGNFEAPTDILYQLFVENRVVVAKAHPLNCAASNFLSSRLLASLVRDGFVGLTSGGPEVGAAILHHPAVDSWMMTGGCATFDAIVWGGKAGKAAGKKQLNKACHAELGAASPYVVVPGPWSASELETQALHLANYKMLNSGHVCASPQIVVVDRQWPLAEQFVAAVERQLDTFPVVPSYYPGSDDRLKTIRERCPSTRVLASNNFHFVPNVDADGGGADYMLQNEAFAPALAIKYLDGGNDAAQFLSKAVPFVNSSCFGSLSLTVAIAPASIAALGEDKFDETLASLRWGAVGVNVWAAFVAGSPVGTWGAPPGRHTLEDVQSGIGLMGNGLLFENIGKSVIRGKWCDSSIAMFRPNTKMAPVMRSLVNLNTQQSVGSLVKVIGAAVFGI